MSDKDKKLNLEDTIKQAGALGWKPTFHKSGIMGLLDGGKLSGFEKNGVKVKSLDDIDRYNKFEIANKNAKLSTAQLASAFAYEHPEQQGRPDIRHVGADPRLQDKTMNVDRNIQAILSIQPQLRDHPDVLMNIASEPYIADRLRGMAKAQTWLQIRSDVVTLQNAPEKHQVGYWKNLPDAAKDAYLIAGYTPPDAPQDPNVKQSGFGLENIVHGTIGAAEHVAKATHLDDLGQPLKMALGSGFKVVGEAAQVVNTGYRVLSAAPLVEDDPRYTSDSWWGKYTHFVEDAWHGESFVKYGNRAKALDLLNGDEDSYDLVARMSAGDTDEDILSQYGDPGSDEYQQAFQKLQDFKNDPLVVKAKEKLEQGKISFGRDLASFIPSFKTPEINVGAIHVQSIDTSQTSNLHTIVSGAADAWWSWKSDPTMIAGEAYKEAKIARYGIDSGGVVERILATANGQTLAKATGRIHEISAELDDAAHVTTGKGYWNDLNKLKINSAQRAQVALADHVDAFLQGDIGAVARLNEAIPASRVYTDSFLKYMDNLVEKAPDGRVLTRVTPDDAVDFLRDGEGMQALVRGEWAAHGTTRMTVPLLSRVGSERVIAKLALSDSMDWLHDSLLKFKGVSTPDDWENPMVTASLMRETLAGSGRLAGDDAMRVFKDQMVKAHLDPETVTRQMNRFAADRAGVVLGKDEKPLEGLLRTIVTSDDAGAEQVREHWTEAVALAADLEPDVARAHVDSFERSYRNALALSEEDGILDRTVTLNNSVREAVDNPLARDRIKNQYLKSLRVDSDTLEAADMHFDDLVERDLAAHANDPINPSTIEPGLAANLKRWVAYPLAMTASAPVRFLEKIATKTPSKNFIAFDAPDDLEVLQQLLDIGVRGTPARELYGQFLLATDAGKRAVVRNVMVTMFNRMGIMDNPKAEEFVSHWLSTVDQRYGLVDAFEHADGTVSNVGILPDSHRARAVAFPQFREIDAQIKRGRFMDYLNGYGHALFGVNSTFSNKLMRVFRIGVVARPAMIPRAGGEELLAQYARFGPDYIRRYVFGMRFAEKEAVEMRRIAGGLGMAQVKDAIDTAMDSEPGHIGGIQALMAKANVPEGFRNQVHAFGELITQGLEKSGGPLTENERFLAALIPTQDVVKSSIAKVSQAEHGIVGEIMDSESRAKQGMAFRVDNGGAVEETLQLAATGRFGEYERMTDGNLYGPRMSNVLMQASHDRAARKAAEVLNWAIHPVDASAIMDHAVAKLGMERGASDGEGIVKLRVGLGTLSTEGRMRLTNWIGRAHVDQFPADLLSASDINHLGKSIGVEGLTKQAVSDMFTTLDYHQRQALNSVIGNNRATSVGWLHDLTRSNSAYQGSAVGDDGLNQLLENSDTWADASKHMATNGFAGPGMYVTMDGRVAEMAMHGETMVQPQVSRLEWKRPVKLIDGSVDTHLADMIEQQKSIKADVIRKVLPGRAGQLLELAYNNGMTSEQMEPLLRDLGATLTVGQKNALKAIIKDSVINASKDADTTAEAIRTHKADLDRLVTMVKGSPALRDEAGLYDDAYREAYGKHVVDHFGKQGFVGIAEGSGGNSGAAIWDPSALTHVDTIPYHESVFHRIVAEDAARKTSDLQQIAMETDPKTQAKMVAKAAADAVERDVLVHQDLSHMDRMKVAQAPAKGQTRMYMPMVPASILQALQETVGTGGAAIPQDIGAITGTAGAVNRAAAETLPGHLNDMVTRLGTDQAANLGSRMATSDPVQARELLDRMRAEIQHRLPDADLDGLHLGYLDLSAAEHRALPARAAVSAEEGVGRAANSDALRWVDNDLVMSRGVSFATDEPNLVIRNLTDDGRQATLDTVNALRQMGGAGKTEGIINDADLMTALRKEFTTQYGDDPQAITILLDELERPRTERADMDTLTQVLGQHRAEVAQHLFDLPDEVYPHLFEGAKGVRVEGRAVPATQNVLVDGITYEQAQRNLAEKIVEHVQALTTGTNGKPIHGVLPVVADGSYRYDLHMAARDMSFPEKLIGPEFKVLSGKSRLQKISVGWMDKVSNGIAVMSRHPLYRKSFVDAAKDAEPIYRRLFTDAELTDQVALMVANPKLAGHRLYELSSAAGHRLEDIEVLEGLEKLGFYAPHEPVYRWVEDADGQIRTVARGIHEEEEPILRWYRAEHEMLDNVVRDSSQRAVKAVIPYIIDHSQKSQFAESIHNVIPFWFAQEQFYKRWALTFTHSPEAFRRMTLTHNALNATGWLSENERGEETFNYPGAEIASKALAHFVDVVTLGRVDGNLPIGAAMTGKFETALPGFDSFGLGGPGPLVALPLTTLRTVFPTIGVPLDDAVMGDYAGRPAWEQIVPAPLRNMFNATLGSDEGLASATIGAIQLMESQHPDKVPGPGASSTEVDIYLERVRHYARILLMEKSILGFFSPAAPQSEFDPKGLNAEFVKSLQAGVPIEEATDRFLKDHPEATAYTLFSSETPSKALMDPTERTYQEILHNGDFYDDHGGGKDGDQAATWLLPQSPPTDPFDRRAFYEMLAHKMRTRKDDIGFYKSMKVAEAADDYYNAEADKDAAYEQYKGNPVARKAIEDHWLEWSAEYKKGHRIFAESLTGVGHENRLSIISTLSAAIDDHRAPDVPQKKLLRNLIDSYQEYVEASSALGDRTVDRNTKAIMKESFIDWATRYSIDDAVARRFFQRILLPEVAPGRGYASDRPHTELEQTGT